MYTNSETVDMARANESNAEFLQRKSPTSSSYPPNNFKTELTWPANPPGPSFHMGDLREFGGTLRSSRSSRW